MLNPTRDYYVVPPRSDRKYNLYARPDFLKILLRRNNTVSEG